MCCCTRDAAGLVIESTSNILCSNVQPHKHSVCAVCSLCAQKLFFRLLSISRLKGISRARQLQAQYHTVEWETAWKMNPAKWHCLSNRNKQIQQHSIFPMTMWLLLSLALWHNIAMNRRASNVCQFKHVYTYTWFDVRISTYEIVCVEFKQSQIDSCRRHKRTHSDMRLL